MYWCRNCIAGSCHVCWGAARFLRGRCRECKYYDICTCEFKEQLEDDP